MQILLVEDSATLRHAVSRIIAEAGHQPVTASSGEEALQMIEHSPFDLIIMDVEMPGLNGFETTRLIRESLGAHWLPIIFVTGKADDASVEEGIEAGGDDYLTKPVSPVILKSKIRAMERIVDMRNQLRAMNEQLEQLSQRDGLTRLYNRRTFDEMAQQQSKVCNRQSHPLSVIMLDIDHFKSYNDHYGHPQGDLCLQQVAQTLQSVLLRPADLLARYGGEEFIALLPDTDLAGAAAVAERMRAAIETLALPHAHSGTAPVVTCSLGVTTSYQSRHNNLAALVKQADLMLYRAKELGRNRVVSGEASDHKTLLLAHPDPDRLQRLSEALSHHGNIVTADSGRDCLELAQSLRPDLIVVDQQLQNMDGASVCRQLSESATTAGLTTVLMTRQDSGDSASPHHCLAASLPLSQLSERLTELLD